MSFYTSLTGLNGAQADIAAISNNIANVGTTGFKRSRAEFGDIFATSPLQANSSAVGSGTIMKSIKQQFTQGNIESSLNALDLSISGQGFFALKPSLTSTQTVYTRNGAFSVNNDRYVVDAQGQLLQVFPVNADGSVIATGIESAKNLQLPTTSGLPKASQTIQLGLNLPADATIIPNNKEYSQDNPYVFDKTNPGTYNQSTSITIYDSLGNATIATIYYVKTSNATEASPTNKWQTHVFVGDREVTPQLISAKDDQSRTYYINKFGEITTAPQTLDPTFNAGAAHPLYKQDEQVNKTPSTAASVIGGVISGTGFDFGETDADQVTIFTDAKDWLKTRESADQATIGSNPPYWGRDMFSISVDGSAPQSISVKAGKYTGTQLAAEMTRAVNEKLGGQRYFSITDTYRKDKGVVVSGNDIIQLNLSRLDDNTTKAMVDPIEIDLLGTAGSDGTPVVLGQSTPENKLQLTREQLVATAQSKLNDALQKRHLEFGKPESWPDPTNPPITVGYDVEQRALTFTVSPSQMGPNASEPESRFNSIKVYNPTDTVNDLGIYPQATSPDTLIRANTRWIGKASLPGGDPIVDPREQRTGVTVNYNKDLRQFTFSSGTTGEASNITVGRAVLAEDADKVPQVNSYDFSTLDLNNSHTINFEVNGRQLEYEYKPSLKPASMSNNDFFWAGAEQAIPVTFSAAESSTKGSSNTKETQNFSVYGKIMNGDKFSIKLVTAPGGATETLTTDALNILSSDTPVVRLTKLRTALQAAITAKGYGVTVSNISNTFSLAYQTNGIVGSPAELNQKVRGSDSTIGATLAAPGLPSVNLSSATVVTSLPTIIQGTGTSYNTQTMTIKSSSGLAPTLRENDKYRITLPMLDGSVVTKEVTLDAPQQVSVSGGGTRDETGLEILKRNLEAATSLVTFSLTPPSNSTANAANTLTVISKTLGVITGAFTLTQTQVGSYIDASGDTIPISKVRPENIGPFSVLKDLDYPNNLDFQGDTAGTPFRLSVRVDGIIKPMLPIGSQSSSSKAGLAIGQAKPSAAMGSNDLLGIGDKYQANQRFVAGTGLMSKAATAVGTRAVTPMSQTFMLNEALGENNMTFTVDGIVGTITLPIRAYTGDTFAAAIQDRVNQIENPVTGRIVSGVTVKFDADQNRLIFTSGTTGSTSQINVVGHPNFGLSNVTATNGKIPIITNLKQATDAQGNKLYVDANGKISTQAPASTQNWYPLYLQEGQLTFDTIGKLISPKEGVVYSPFDPQNGSDLLRLNIDYGKFSTQYSSPFSVLSLSQDGYPSGSLNGLDIDASGTIRANYTNGETAALGKIMVANFANSNGLKQVGNATYVATSVSGQAVLGQAGADGFGTIKAGALERSNVDITQELVNLITAQRNFQANAKAIETTTTLSQTIIQIRG